MARLRGQVRIWSGSGSGERVREGRQGLAPGLQIRAGAGSGRRTLNPILDQHITVEVGPDTPDSMLAALPAEALLPLLLEPSSARIHSGGVEIRLTGPPSLATLAQAIADLERVLPHLPRERTST